MNFHETHKMPYVNWEKVRNDLQDEYNDTWLVKWWTKEQLENMREKHGDAGLSYMLGFNPFLELKL